MEAVRKRRRARSEITASICLCMNNGQHDARRSGVFTCSLDNLGGKTTDCMLSEQANAQAVMREQCLPSFLYFFRVIKSISMNPVDDTIRSDMFK